MIQNSKIESMCVYYLIKCVDNDDDMSPCGKSKYDCGNEATWSHFVEMCPNHHIDNICRHSDNLGNGCSEMGCPRIDIPADFDFSDL